MTQKIKGQQPTCRIGGKVVAREPYENYDRPCGDCGAAGGQVHIAGCDTERCPKCGGQFMFGCCLDEYEEPSE